MLDFSGAVCDNGPNHRNWDTGGGVNAAYRRTGAGQSIVFTIATVATVAVTVAVPLISTF